MPATKMLSLAALAVVVGVAVANPHPECAECAKVTDPELESLTNSDKVRVCVKRASAQVRILA